MHLTSQDLVLYFGLLLTVLNIIDRLSILKAKASAPQKELEARVKLLEDELKQYKNLLKDVIEKYSMYFNNDNKRIVNLEEGGRVLIKAMGSLLSHGIDGNNIQEMKDARDEINHYLINR